MGRKQAEKASKIIPEVQCCISSPLSRAYETAVLALGSRKIPIMKDPLLIEQRYGLSEASSQRVAFHWPLHPLYNYVRHPERYHPPVGGESFDDLYRRAEQFIRESLKPLEGQYDAVLVSAHGAILCALQGCMFDVPVSDFWTMILPNCGIRTILMDQGVFTRQ